ncbi:MAG TPA: N,N-dimethylformamidase beta subunit family domain-containing protein [Dehalococcoidia bacterium]|nr:N,N-dimethylformamidase beta subunit family domain-containing protein [Dehalococcoidia bacterium]
MRHRALAIGAIAAVAVLAAAVYLAVRADPAAAPDIQPSPTPPPAVVAAVRSPVARENQLAGTPGWEITSPALDGQIQAYAGQTSVQAGETLDLYVSTAGPNARYDVAIYRMGWYHGIGARLVRSVDNVPGSDQGNWTPAHGLQRCRTCSLDPATLLVQANWKRSLQIGIGADWVSGYYLARLRERKSGTETYAVFVVRDDASTAPILVQAPTNTWEAYNTWGDASLYGSFRADRRYVPKTRRAHRVSYDRPYDPTLRNRRNYGAGEFFNWEVNFVRWAESRGYDMTYTTNVDVSQHGATLLRHRLFVSLGHDEYWTSGERDAVEAARDAGVSVAFLGGNEAYWQVRLEPAAGGAPARILAAYKDAALDPIARTDPKGSTSLFADRPVERPESLLSGLAYGSNATPGQQPWRPATLDSWVFAATGIKAGAAFPGIVGYEYDRMPPPTLRPPGLVAVGFSPVRGYMGADIAISSLYRAPSGAFVFNAGTVAWAWGLDDYGHEAEGRFADDRLRRMTANILDRLSATATVGTTGS